MALRTRVVDRADAHGRTGNGGPVCCAAVVGMRGSLRRPLGAWASRAVIAPGFATALLLAARMRPLPALVMWSASGTARGAAVGVTLDRSGLRLSLSPLLSTLEALSLLTAVDHVTVLVSLVTLAAVLGTSGRTFSSAPSGVGRLRSGARWAAYAVLALAALYVLGALLPWPMARLGRDDPDEVVVDFHSHTNQSHDGRWAFSIARNRAWHRAGGFDVAYVTDHADSADVPLNDVAGSARPIMLTGAEFRTSGAHVVRLGLASEADAVLVLTTPFPADATARLRASGTAVAGLEVVDASPRGLQWMSDRPIALQSAVSTLRAVPVASSNLHGWGRTVAAWSLLRLPGWQRDDPRVLDRRIRMLLRTGDRSKTRIVARSAPRTASGALARSLALPLLVWTTLRTLDASEIPVWLAWIWFPWFVLVVRAATVRRARGAAVERSDGRHGIAVSWPTRAPRQRVTLGKSRSRGRIPLRDGYE